MMNAPLAIMARGASLRLVTEEKMSKKKLNSNEQQNQVLEEIVRMIREGKLSTIQELLEVLLNALMIAERNLAQRQNSSLKANGFYPRSLSTGAMQLNVKVPRTRHGKFRPSLLPPPWKRTCHDYQNFLLALLAEGYSVNQIKRLLSRLEAPYSEEEVEELLEELNLQLQQFKSRQLDKDWLAVIVDAYSCQLLEGGVSKKVQIYIVAGISLEGEKELLGWWIGRGAERRSFWMEVFRQLIERGLRRVMIIVSDDLPGLAQAASQLFPGADWQLCLFHLRRNMRFNISRADIAQAQAFVKKITYAADFQEGERLWQQMLQWMKQRYPHFARHLQARSQNYLAFLKYPFQVRRHIYTTNLVESFNALLEKERYSKRGIFQSEKVADFTIMLIYQRLKEGKWSKPIPAVKAASYELRQLFAIKFGQEELDG